VAHLEIVERKAGAFDHVCGARHGRGDVLAGADVGRGLLHRPVEDGGDLPFAGDR